MQSYDISAKLSSKSHGTSPLALGARKPTELFCSSFALQCDFLLSNQHSLDARSSVSHNDALSLQ